MVFISDYEWPAVYRVTQVTHTMYCNYTKRLLGEAHLLNQGMYPLLTQSLGSISVKPVIVFELISDAKSTTPFLGWDNGASVRCLDKVGTSEVSLPNCHACVPASDRYRLSCCVAWKD